MTGRGEPWGVPADPAAPTVTVTGGDPDLAAAAGTHPDAVLLFRPTGGSDLARALGITAGAPGPGATVLPCDLMDLGAGLLAVNAVVLGHPPDRVGARHRRHRVRVEVDGRPVGADRATTVVVASGQFAHGANLVPRGHPGDGRVEVQVYALAPAERRAMRARLATGDHVPHPRIAQASGRHVVVTWASAPRPLEVDGHAVPPREQLTVTVRPGAARVLL